MPFTDSDGIRYLTFDSFSSSVLHGAFTRRGGVSPAPWDSLNVGGTVGDERERVLENRRRSYAAFGRRPASGFEVWQVHSADVVCAEAPLVPGSDLTKADILLTDRREVTLYMRFADCVPLFFHDPVKGVIGMAHAGWQGTMRGAARSTVEAMQARYESHPADIIAGIGPSIGPDHYEVGAEVVRQFREVFEARTDQLIHQHDGRTHLDLWAANRLQLQDAGVERIELAGVCTACHLEDWYSHRAEKGRTGRFGALIALA